MARTAPLEGRRAAELSEAGCVGVTRPVVPLTVEARWSAGRKGIEGAEAGDPFVPSEASEPLDSPAVLLLPPLS